MADRREKLPLAFAWPQRVRLKPEALGKTLRDRIGPAHLGDVFVVLGATLEGSVLIQNADKSERSHWVAATDVVEVKD